MNQTKICANNESSALERFLIIARKVWWFSHASWLCENKQRKIFLREKFPQMKIILKINIISLSSRNHSTNRPIWYGHWLSNGFWSIQKGALVETRKWAISINYDRYSYVYYITLIWIYRTASYFFVYNWRSHWISQSKSQNFHQHIAIHDFCSDKKQFIKYLIQSHPCPFLLKGSYENFVISLKAT